MIPGKFTGPVNSIIPASYGMTAVLGSEKEQGEMAQTIAALRIKYTFFSVNHLNNETIFPDNRGGVIAPVEGMDADPETPRQIRMGF